MIKELRQLLQEIHAKTNRILETHAHVMAGVARDEAANIKGLVCEALDLMKTAGSTVVSRNTVPVSKDGKNFDFDALRFIPINWQDLFVGLKPGDQIRVSLTVKKASTVITAERFKEAVGEDPAHDDLERCNCLEAGKPGHHACGWCDKCDKPRFICAHLKFGKDVERPVKKKKKKVVCEPPSRTWGSSASERSSHP